MNIIIMYTHKQEILFQRLLTKQERRGTQVYMRYHMDENPQKPDSLFNLLSLDRSCLTEDGHQILEYLENKEEDSTSYCQYRQFKWKVEAFLSLQDIFSLPMVTGGTSETLFQIMYYYYESKYLLTESIIGGLNGLHIVNKQALRSFLEFNLLQNYFFAMTRNACTYQSFTEYMRTGFKPTSGTLIKKALPADEFCKPIKKRLQVELDNLSNRYSHPYVPADSPKHFGVFTPDVSFESLYFYIHISAVLDITLWMYYVNFPMLFFPVDIIRKFGFNPPVGLFVTPSTTRVLQQAMSAADFILFKDYASTSSIIADLLHFYDGQAIMSDEQIWETWTGERDKKDTLHSCFAKSVAQQRAIHEMMATYRQPTAEKEEDYAEMDRLSEKYIKYYTEFASWRKIYKKVK